MPGTIATAFYAVTTPLAGRLPHVAIGFQSKPDDARAVVAASKAGLEGMMHGYASLLAKEGITANAIAPALIKTDMIAGVTAADPARLPVGRLGEANEVSSLVVELARNGYITGQTIQVNGGVYMT
jgi:NAD(P)-dependent dehydrogenase (short-subunit alcohol dehydrogenase family)